MAIGNLLDEERERRVMDSAIELGYFRCLTPRLRRRKPHRQAIEHRKRAYRSPQSRDRETQMLLID